MQPEPPQSTTIYVILCYVHIHPNLPNQPQYIYYIIYIHTRTSPINHNSKTPSISIPALPEYNPNAAHLTIPSLFPAHRYYITLSLALSLSLTHTHQYMYPFRVYSRLKDVILYHTYIPVYISIPNLFPAHRYYTLYVYTSIYIYQFRVYSPQILCYIYIYV
jgi:hypothetical protein